MCCKIPALMCYSYVSKEQYQTQNLKKKVVCCMFSGCWDKPQSPTAAILSETAQGFMLLTAHGVFNVFA